MVNPYEPKPETKWYHVLWDLRNHEFRQWWIKNKRRDVRMHWKYERHRVFEKAGFGVFLAAIAVFICGTDTVAALFRWPTEDPNELLKREVWQKRRNELNERRSRADKMLAESSFMQKKNNPVQ